MKQHFLARYKWFFTIAGGLVIVYFLLRPYISVQSLQKHDYYFQDFINHNYLGAVAIYIMIYVCIIASSLPLTGPLAIAGGFLFGTLRGFLFAEVGTIVGSTGAFLILRSFSVTGILQDQRKRFHVLEQKVKKNGVGYLLMLSLLSVVPFIVINTVALLANVSVFTVAWTSALGSMPLVFVYALAGSQLRAIGSLKDILSPQLVVVLLLLAAMVFVMPRVFNKIKGLDR